MTLQELYDRQAARYDAERDQSLFERAWLDRVLADVPQEGAVLDLGCGAGRPIGAFVPTDPTCRGHSLLLARLAVGSCGDSI